MSAQLFPGSTGLHLVFEYWCEGRPGGWRLHEARYDDGGVSGGTLDRPALERLLEDIEAGRICMVVVCKIDQLTRSLADFSRSAANRQARASRTNTGKRTPLAGKVFDAEGAPLFSSHASKKGWRYRYYISKHHLMESGERKAGWQLPAGGLSARSRRALRPKKTLARSISRKISTCPIFPRIGDGNVGHVVVSLGRVGAKYGPAKLPESQQTGWR